MDNFSAVGPVYRDAQGNLRSKGRFSAVGPVYIDPQGNLRVKAGSTFGSGPRMKYAGRRPTTKAVMDRFQVTG